MLSAKMQKALNDQINLEFSSAYIYLAMSAYFESINMSGGAHWMQAQYQEEQGHALKLIHFVHERDGRVTLQAIKAPPGEWASLLAVFEQSLEHERKVSAAIHKLVDLALQERDYPTNSFLQWFVNEQVEEESAANGIVQKLKLIGENTNGLFMVDRELSKRA